MFRSRMQSGVALLVAILFLCATSLVHAAEDTSYTARIEDVSAEADYRGWASPTTRRDSGNRAGDGSVRGYLAFQYSNEECG